MSKAINFEKGFIEELQKEASSLSPSFLIAMAILGLGAASVIPAAAKGFGTMLPFLMFRNTFIPKQEKVEPKEYIGNVKGMPISYGDVINL